MITLLGENMNNIKNYLETKKYNPSIPLEKNIFEWELAIQYGIEFQKHVRGEIVQTEEHLQFDRNLIISHGVSEEMIEHIELFCILDKEYKEHIKSPGRTPMEQPILKKDPSWKGFWLKATGNDFSLYIHWIKAGIQEQEYKTKTFIEKYLEEHPKIKDLSEVPYAVKTANIIFEKYYKL